MKDVKLLGMIDSNAGEKAKAGAGEAVVKVEERDEVQDWWEQVVEPL